MTAPLNDPFYQVVTIPPPAAGQDFTLACNQHGPWRVLSLAFTLTTSAVVANRLARLRVTDGTTNIMWTRAAAVHGAGALGVYSAFAGVEAGVSAGGVSLIPWPVDGPLLLPGWRIVSSVDLLDAGDTLTDIGALVQVFPAGRAGRYEPGPAPIFTPRG